jgi:hypothetical protein
MKMVKSLNKEIIMIYGEISIMVSLFIEDFIVGLCAYFLDERVNIHMKWPDELIFMKNSRAIQTV